jgi:hypothetical protein
MDAASVAGSNGTEATDFSAAIKNTIIIHSDDEEPETNDQEADSGNAVSRRTSKQSVSPPSLTHSH